MTNTTVAIKVIDKIRNYRNLSAIEREIKTLQSLVVAPYF